jgi:hypothetical protein
VFIAAFVAVLATTGAEARPEKVDGATAVSHNSGSITRASMSRNFKSKSNGRYAYSKSKKRYARSGGHSHGGGTSRTCLTSAASALLGRIEATFGPVQIVSTCRPGAVIAGSGKPSKHRYGQAIDFNAGGRKAAIVNWLIANHHSGGTMTYAGMNHIHVDIGYHFVKLNHGGRRSRA